MAGLNDGVPIITVGGLSKRFLVPGKLGEGERGVRGGRRLKGRKLGN